MDELQLGDLVQMRKTHPCGSDKWTVIRVGADIKIRCSGCGRIVMMDRADFTKRMKKVIEHAKEPIRGHQRRRIKNCKETRRIFSWSRKRKTQKKKEKPKKSLKREIFEWVMVFVVAAALAFVVRTFIFEPVRVDGTLDAQHAGRQRIHDRDEV